MQAWKERLSTIGQVETFDYEYILEKRRYPDPLPKLIARHLAALEQARKITAAPVFLIGKSMGGRIGCHVALEETVAGVICLGYPLCGGGDRARLRDKVLLDLRTPILFVQGTRDPLCPLDLLEEVRPRMVAPNELHVVDDGDHSFKVRLRQGMKQTDADERILEAIAGFVGAAML